MKKSIGIIIALCFVLNGCVVFYGVSNNSDISTIQYDPNIIGVNTGTASIFVSDDSEYKRFSRYLLKKNSNIAFYEDDSNIYFLHEKVVYGLNIEVKKSKSFLKSLSKIPVKNIECKDQICKISGKISPFKITVREGFAGNLDFEYIDFSSSRDRYYEAMDTYNHRLVSSPASIEIRPFLNKNRFDAALEKATAENQILELEKIAKAIGYDNLNYKFSKKKEQLEFQKDYSKIGTYTLAEKKKFVEKYAKSLASNQCSIVMATKLNIRSKPSTKSKIIGVYKKGDSFCAVAEQKGWVKNDRGWVSGKFLSVGRLNDFSTQVSIVQKEIEKIERQKILNSNSTEEIKKYSLLHSADKPIRDKLLRLYRKNATFTGYIGAYEITKSLDDLKNAFRVAKTKEEKLLAEKFMIKNAPLSNIFKISELSTSVSGGKVMNLIGETIPIMQKVSELSGEIQKNTKTFEVTSQIPLEGSYKVHVNFEQEIRTKVESNLFQGWIGAISNLVSAVDKKNYPVVFQLDPKNSYRDVVDVTFTFGTASMISLGINMSGKIISSKVNVSLVDVEQI